jgi:hypothetical protein
MQNEPNFHHFSSKNACLNQKRSQFEAKRSQFWANIRGAKPKRTQFKTNFKRMNVNFCAIG